MPRIHTAAVCEYSITPTLRPSRLPGTRMLESVLMTMKLCLNLRKGKTGNGDEREISAAAMPEVVRQRHLAGVEGVVGQHPREDLRWRLDWQERQIHAFDRYLVGHQRMRVGIRSAGERQLQVGHLRDETEVGEWLIARQQPDGLPRDAPLRAAGPAGLAAAGQDLWNAKAGLRRVANPDLEERQVTPRSVTGPSSGVFPLMLTLLMSCCVRDGGSGACSASTRPAPTQLGRHRASLLILSRAHSSTAVRLAATVTPHL